MNCSSTTVPPGWMTISLRLAAVYNLAWGALVIAAPLLIFRWTGMAEPRYPQIWQCVGMIVGVYGIGYWLASKDPFRHWPIVFVGFLGKLFGPIGFLGAATSGELPWAWGVTILTNDVIWWVPFAVILYGAFRANTDTSQDTPSSGLNQAIGDFRSHRNASLLELSNKAPTLVVFLRHSGCTFCRETLVQLAASRQQIERTGTTIAVVHMGTPMEGTLMMEKYGLATIHRFSDPECTLYRSFGIARGRFAQLFSVNVLMRGLRVAFRGHGIGLLHGDGFRLAGSFILVRGQLVKAHLAKSAAETIDFVDFAADAARSWRHGSAEVAGSRKMRDVHALVKMS